MNFDLNKSIYRVSKDTSDPFLNYTIEYETTITTFSAYLPPKDSRYHINSNIMFRKLLYPPFSSSHESNPYGLFISGSQLVIGATYSNRLGLIYTDEMLTIINSVLYRFSGPNVGNYQLGIKAIQSQTGGYVILAFGPAPDTLGIYILKVDQNNNPVCSRILRADKRILPRDLYEDNDGNIVVVGYTTAGPNPKYKGLVAKLDQNCGLIRAYLIEGVSHFNATTVTQLDNGDYLIAGSEGNSNLQAMIIFTFSNSFSPLSFRYIRTLSAFQPPNYSPYHEPRIILKQQNDVKIIGIRSEYNINCSWGSTYGANIMLYSLNGNWMKAYYPSIPFFGTAAIQNVGNNTVIKDGYIYLPGYYFNPILDCDAGNMDAFLLKVQDNDGSLIRYWNFFGVDEPTYQNGIPIYEDGINFFKNVVLLNSNVIYVSENHTFYSVIGLNRLFADSVCRFNPNPQFLSYDVSFQSSPWCAINASDLNCADAEISAVEFTNSITTYTPTVTGDLIILGSGLDCEVTITPMSSNENASCTNGLFRIKGNIIYLKQDMNYELYSIDGSLLVKGKGNVVEARKGLNFLKLGKQVYKIIIN